MGMPQPIADWLAPFVRAHRIGRVLLSPADIEFDERTLVQPDLFVAPLVEGRQPRTWHEIQALLLAVEVLSPTTARADRQVKRRRYQRHGVPEYWTWTSTPGGSNAGACPTSGRRCWPSDSSGTLPRRSRPFPSTSPGSSPRLSTSKVPPYARAAAP